MPTDPEAETNHTNPKGYAAIESEVEAWAAREHQRRQAWLGGPSEREKAAMKAQLLAREALLSDDNSFDASKVDEEVAFWAEREHARRKAWADGPDLARDRPDSSPEPWRDNRDMIRDDIVRAWTRGDYAARGLWHRLYSDLNSFYSELVEEGRRSSMSSPRRRRIFY